MKDEILTNYNESDIPSSFYPPPHSSFIGKLLPAGHIIEVPPNPLPGSLQSDSDKADGTQYSLSHHHGSIDCDERQTDT